ncbi:MAG: ATPase, T2SS/T4P/T4SS family [Erysipelotrichaceae bacterium]
MEEKLEKLMALTLENRASDIHIQIKENHIKVFLRKNKELILTNFKIDSEFISYLLYRAKLDISLKAKPQTGVFDCYYDYHQYSLRVAMIQSYNYSSIVLRILNQYNFLSFSDLTNDQLAIKKLESFSKYEYGLLIFSGPTGSGKTTSAYTMLRQFTNLAIYTIEDPIEVKFNEFVQLQVNESLNLDFANSIKQILRHDPDIIFIGEIRDEYSAKMAIRSALSGHLVIATIHSGSASSTIQRLLDFEVKAVDLREVLIGVINQRLSYQKSEERYLATYSILEQKEIF